MAQPLQLVVFEGCPPSLGGVAQRFLQRGQETAFLCVLGPSESSDEIYRTWHFSVQPLDPTLTLHIIHAPQERYFEGIAEFATELASSRGIELDVLLLSDEASWRGSRRLASGLRGLQVRLDREVPGCLVRRV